MRDLVEQVPFTSPGERLVRPVFGCGQLDLGSPGQPVPARLVRGAHPAESARYGRRPPVGRFSPDGMSRRVIELAR